MSNIVPIPELRTATGKRPMKHQVEALQFLESHPRAFLWHTMGLGKTLTSLWAAQRVGAHRVLVFCPLSLIKAVWEPTIQSEFAGYFTPVSLAGDKYQRQAAIARADKLLARRQRVVLLANHDAARTLPKMFPNAPLAPDFAIVDESTAFKSTNAARTKGALGMLKDVKHIILATGTPITNSPMDLYGQAKLVCPDRVPKTENAYRNLTMNLDYSGFNWSPAPNWESRVKSIFELAHRRRLRDCVDLPPVIKRRLKVELTPQQRLAMRNVEKHGHALASRPDSDQARLLHAAALRQEAQRIAAGVAKVDEDKYGLVDATPRWELLDTLVDESETPPIIFAQHVPIVLAIAERLGVEPIYGDTSSAKRHEIITEFRAGGLPALVCHPAVMAHGVDLTCSNHIIFAQPPLSVEQWLQAVARIERLGQTLKMMVSLIEGSSVERDTWDRLENKITDVDNLEAVIKLVSEDV